MEFNKNEFCKKYNIRLVRLDNKDYFRLKKSLKTVFFKYKN